MNLNGLTHYLVERKQEFERDIKLKSRGITLKEIIESGQPAPWGLRDRFQYGHEIRYHLHQGVYEVHLSPENLILQTRDIELTRFRGTKVKSLYKKLATAIMKAKEEDIPPF